VTPRPRKNQIYYSIPANTTVADGLLFGRFELEGTTRESIFEEAFCFLDFEKVSTSLCNRHDWVSFYEADLGFDGEGSYPSDHALALGVFDDTSDHARLITITSLQVRLLVGSISGEVRPIDHYDPQAGRLQCRVFWREGWVDGVTGRHIECSFTREGDQDERPTHHEGRISPSSFKKAIFSALTEAVKMKDHMHPSFKETGSPFPAGLNVPLLLRDRWCSAYYSNGNQIYRIELELARRGVPFAAMRCYEMKNDVETGKNLVGQGHHRLQCTSGRRVCASRFHSPFAALMPSRSTPGLFDLDQYPKKLVKQYYLELIQRVQGLLAQRVPGPLGPRHLLDQQRLSTLGP
jgi:hypothetical protein